MKVAILMGSKSDMEFAQKVGKQLDYFGVNYDYRISSAHKTPIELLDVIKEYDAQQDIVFIAIAGRSNALCGMLDANTAKPVITCPPYSDKFGGTDIFSSLRMPGGVAPMVIIDPKGAAVAAVKILSLKDTALEQKLRDYKQKVHDAVVESDKELRK